MLVRFLGRPAGTAVYLRGSFADGDAVLGLSDLDLIVVTPDGRASAAAGKSPLDPLVNVKVYAASELEAAAASTVLTHPAALFTGGRHFSLRTRPGLAGATRDWCRLTGPESRPAQPGAPDPCVAAWLELQCWWRYAVWAAAHPADRQVPYLCFKLVAEETRIWLWLVHGELPRGRTAALRRGLELMPEDERTLRDALALHSNLHRAPRHDLDGTLYWLVGMSQRIAAVVADRAAQHPPTAVRLDVDDAGTGSSLPLMDWRGLVVPERGPREVLVADGDPGQAATLAAADRAEREGTPWLLRAGDIFLIPSSDIESSPMTRGTLRIVQCAASDPVTTALLAGRREASFPDIPGWRAIDWAQRAVAERRAAGSDPAATARAEGFLESLERGEPTLSIG